MQRSEHAPAAPYTDLPDDDALVLLIMAHQHAFGFDGLEAPSRTNMSRRMTAFGRSRQTSSATMAS